MNTSLFARLRAGPPLAKEPIRYRSGPLEITGLMCRPLGPGPFPVIVVNHGGFDPASSVGGLLHLFAKLGYFAVASDYRGTGGSQGQHEMALGEVDDVLALLDWAVEQPGVDVRRCVSLGLSHGGAVALLAAARSSVLRGVVNLVGPADMASWWQHVVSTAAAGVPNCQRLLQVIGAVPGLANFGPREWQPRSPLAVADRIRCPVLLIYGAADDMVPAEQGIRLAEALRASGNTAVELIIDPEAGHYFDTAAWDRVGRRILNFLAGCVELPPIPPEA